MKGLSINSFWNMRPKLPFRFKVDFYTGLYINDNDKNLTYCVTNVTLPKIEGQASEGSLYLGNTIFTIPVWNVSSRKLDISFEETDTMFVLHFLDKLLQYYGRSPWYITIVINEYEEHIRDEKTTKYEPGDKYATAYVCHLASYEEPQFKRDGAAQQVTINASFIVDSVIEDWVQGTTPFTGQKHEKSNVELNNDLTYINVNEQNQKFEFGDVRYGGSNTTRYDSGDSYNDLIVEDEELDAVMAKINDSKYKNLGITREKIEAVQKENAKRMESSLGTLKKALAAKGITVKITAYNDANHEIGIGSNRGSHLLGQKVDLYFETKDGKITMENMTEAQRKEIVELAKASNLVPNWETNGSAGSGWGDFSLAEAKTINSHGEIDDVKIVSWTGEDQAYNTSTQSKQKVGKK